MAEEKEKIGLVGGLMMIVMAFVIIVVVVYMFSIFTYETEIVEGDVVNVIPYDNYMTIIMDDGKSYNIKYPGDNIDLTEGSDIIMKLTNTNYFFIDDGIWETVSITKVPEKS
jgi:hypothetical protein